MTNLIFSVVTMQRLSTTLTGYLMNDGTFQFMIQGKMQSYASLAAVWLAYIEI